jgi:hypothetical protein
MFWASWIQFTFWHTVTVRSVFVLPFHLCPSLKWSLSCWPNCSVYFWRTHLTVLHSVWHQQNSRRTWRDVTCQRVSWRMLLHFTMHTCLTLYATIVWICFLFVIGRQYFSWTQSSGRDVRCVLRMWWHKLQFSKFCCLYVRRIMKNDCFPCAAQLSEFWGCEIVCVCVCEGVSER